MENMKRTRQRLFNALEATADEVIRIRKIGNNYKTFSVAVEDSPPFDAAKETIFVDGLAWKLLYLFSDFCNLDCSSAREYLDFR